MGGRRRRRNLQLRFFRWYDEIEHVVDLSADLFMCVGGWFGGWYVDGEIEVGGWVEELLVAWRECRGGTFWFWDYWFWDCF